jgi:hypothetical protein
VERSTLILLALVVAPVPLVLIVALIRGYRITLLMRRDRGRGED